MASGIGANGAVAIYGIYFDTAKADLKPESEPALAEVAKLLKENPALKVFVVGHTDMVGDPAANMKLSQARAQAVVSALVAKYGIAAQWLAPFGSSPTRRWPRTRRKRAGPRTGGSNWWSSRPANRLAGARNTAYH